MTDDALVTIKDDIARCTKYNRKPDWIQCDPDSARALVREVEAARAFYKAWSYSKGFAEVYECVAARAYDAARNGDPSE